MCRVLHSTRPIESIRRNFSRRLAALPLFRFGSSQLARESLYIWRPRNSAPILFLRVRLLKAAAVSPSSRRREQHRVRGHSGSSFRTEASVLRRNYSQSSRRARRARAKQGTVGGFSRSRRASLSRNRGNRRLVQRRRNLRLV